MIVRIFILFLCAAVLFSCATTNVHSPDAALYDGKAGSAQTLESFSERIVQAFADNDVNFFKKEIDEKALAERTKKELEKLRPLSSSIKIAANRIVKNVAGGLFSQISPNMQATFLRVEPSGGSGALKKLLFRLEDEESFSYVKFFVDEQTFKIVDYINYDYARTISFILATAVDQGFEVNVKSDFETRLKYQRFLDAVAAVDDHNDLQQRLAVRKAYFELPVSLRQTEYALVVLARSIQSESVEYYASLALIEQYYGQEKQFALMMLNFYVYHERFDDARRALDVLKSEVGNDVSLLNAQAAFAIMDKDYRDAVAYLHDSIEADRSRQLSYVLLAQALSQLERFDDAVLSLRIVEEVLGIEVHHDVLRDSGEFGGLVSSQPYKNWFSARAAP